MLSLGQNYRIYHYNILILLLFFYKNTDLQLLDFALTFGDRYFYSLFFSNENRPPESVRPLFYILRTFLLFLFFLRFYPP